MDDIEFWLSGLDAAQQNDANDPGIAPTPAIALNSRPIDPPTSLPVTVETRPSDEEQEAVRRVCHLVCNP